MHTTFKSGLQLYEFDSGQVEKHHPDGSQEIIFSDSTKKLIYADGREKVVFTDGRTQIIDSGGNKSITYPDGTLVTYFYLGNTRKRSQNQDIFIWSC